MEYPYNKDMKKLSQYINESLLDDEDKIIDKQLSLFNTRTFNMARNNVISFLMDNNGKYVFEDSAYDRTNNVGLYTQTWNRRNGTYIRFAIIQHIYPQQGIELSIHYDTDHNRITISRIAEQDVFRWAYSDNNDEDGYFIFNELTKPIEEFISKIFNEAKELKKSVHESLLDDEDKIIDKKIAADKQLRYAFGKLGITKKSYKENVDGCLDIIKNLGTKLESTADVDANKFIYIVRLRNKSKDIIDVYSKEGSSVIIFEIGYDYCGMKVYTNYITPGPIERILQLCIDSYNDVYVINRHCLHAIFDTLYNQQTKLYNESLLGDEDNIIANNKTTLFAILNKLNVEMDNEAYTDICNLLNDYCKDNFKPFHEYSLPPKEDEALLSIATNEIYIAKLLGATWYTQLSFFHNLQDKRYINTWIKDEVRFGELKDDIDLHASNYNKHTTYIIPIDIYNKIKNIFTKSAEKTNSTIYKM